jgi:hypothetical protein
LEFKNVGASLEAGSLSAVGMRIRAKPLFNHTQELLL